MFFKFSLILALFFFACARPNYQNNPSMPPEEAKDLSSCSLVLNKINQCVSLAWVKQSTDSEMGVFDLEFSSELSADPRVVLWMPSMGHGSRPTTVARLSPTQFQVSNVAFIMPGEWEIRIRVLDSNNQVLDEVAQKIIY